MQYSLSRACRLRLYKQLFPDGRVILKPMSGMEALQVIGWGKSHWKNGWQDNSPYHRNTDVQLRKMAGNAFSGFVLAPVLAALISCRGLVYSAEDSSLGKHYALIGQSVT